MRWNFRCATRASRIGATEELESAPPAGHQPVHVAARTIRASRTAAQVEHQLKSNTQLETLVSLQKTAQATQALGYVGQTVATDGQILLLSTDGAGWSFNSPKLASAAINIINSTGATVFAGNCTLNAGIQNFVWDGRNNSGVEQADGDYKLAITAKDASGHAVAVSTEVQGVCRLVDMTKNTPILSVNNTEYALDKIKRVVRQISLSL